ncbi:MAG: hypothetical protein H6773_04360 [Pseudomonadales bacterium]|nr:hypothetical protein [Pseudomonadales bacterium]
MEIVQNKRVRKGSMKVGDELPYSAEGLQALASTLKIHKDLMWFDATASRIAFKQLPVQERSTYLEEEEE